MPSSYVQLTGVVPCVVIGNNAVVVAVIVPEQFVYAGAVGVTEHSPVISATVFKANVAPVTSNKVDPPPKYKL